MPTKRYFNWKYALFFTTVPLVGLLGTILLLCLSTILWQTWVLAGVFLVLGGLSITAGYHRLFAHRTYRAVWPVRLFFVLFGASSFEGSVLEWSTDHRNHHRYTDTSADPYNIQQGFWYAHIGWLFRLNPTERDFSNVADLEKSKLLVYQDRYFVVFAVIMGLVLPTAIAAIWGQALAGFIVAGLLRLTIVHHGTFCINSVCHTFGRRDYSRQLSARDNWFSAWLTFGEGYHNYHHQFPRDYRNGVKVYQFDPSKWLIVLLARLKLASHLCCTPKYRIIQARFEAQVNRLPLKRLSPMLLQLQDAIGQCLIKIKQLENDYKNKVVKEYRVKIRLATRELGDLFGQWKHQLVLSAPEPS